MANNHAYYQSRLDFIARLLADDLHLSSEDVERTAIKPIQYDPDSPFKYNNFVYLLSLPIDLSRNPIHSSLPQPGCSLIPAGMRDFILRLSNSEAHGMHLATRIQNEVCMLSLASAALKHVEPNVVPRVFAWSGAGQGQIGWILQELMPGSPLIEPFCESMSFEEKTNILRQIASLLKGLQDYSLPESIQGWGGVTFDEKGAMVSAAMTSVGAGPWASLEESFNVRLKCALTKTDASDHLQGWRDDGVRTRIERFIEHGLPMIFSDIPSRNDRSIVHADFTVDNLLYDPATGRITALLDYDFSSVLHPAHEFFRSFQSNGGHFAGWPGNTTLQEQEELKLHDAQLSGIFISPVSSPRASADGAVIDWQLARAWEIELQKIDAKRPSTIHGIDKMADVDELLGAILPWRLTNEDFLRMNSDREQLKALKRFSQRKLVALLEHMGF